MQKLNKNWFYENHADFEYKKYVLLAYLQSVHKEFNQTKLYPALSDLVEHYRNLIAFKKQKDELYHHFPEYIDKIDLSNFKLHFNKVISNDELIHHLDEVIAFSLPEMQKHIEEGKDIHDFIEQEILLEPVGIMPIYKNEGYMLLKSDEIKVYEYKLGIFMHKDDEYKSLSTQLIKSYKIGFINTFENIKIDLIKHHRKLPNPATFSIQTHYEYPVEYTILPIAKRLLLKQIA